MHTAAAKDIDMLGAANSLLVFRQSLLRQTHPNLFLITLYVLSLGIDSKFTPRNDSKKSLSCFTCSDAHAGGRPGAPGVHLDFFFLTSSIMFKVTWGLAQGLNKWI